MNPHPIEIRGNLLTRLALKQKSNSPFEFVLAHLAGAKTVEDIAVSFWAWQELTGEVVVLPESRPVKWVQAQALLHVAENVDRTPQPEKTPKGLTTPWPDESFGLSDSARKDQAEYRQAKGYIFVGPRHVGKGPKQTRARFGLERMD